MIDLHAFSEYTACMKSSQKRQYTIRNISPQLDKELRKKISESGKSLNEAVLDTLKRGVGLTDQPIVHHDLDPLIGTWKEDPEFEEAIRQQDQIDPRLWS